jgi:hypothetical protein
MTESQIERDIIKYLRLRGFLVIQTHGPRNRPVAEGLPDLLVYRGKWQQHVWVEVKTATGKLSQAQAEGFYAVHRERPFFKDLVKYMTSGPVVVQVLEGENAVLKNREIMGATDLSAAIRGIRADALGTLIDGFLPRNVPHEDWDLDGLRDAVAKGATLHTGGHRGPGPGLWFPPTVLTRVDHRMDVMREESFGPIVGIQKVKDDDEAVALMNDTRYGLTAGVYSPDEATARALLARVNAGSVYWNCCDRVSPRLPWSGHGDSGIGLTLSTHGIQTFTRPKAWHLRK